MEPEVPTHCSQASLPMQRGGLQAIHKIFNSKFVLPTRSAGIKIKQRLREWSNLMTGSTLIQIYSFSLSHQEIIGSYEIVIKYNKIEYSQIKKYNMEVEQNKATEEKQPKRR